jgi:hypothetical protein
MVSHCCLRLASDLCPGLQVCITIPVLFVDMGLPNFLFRLTSNCDLPISASWVGGVIGVSHHAWPDWFLGEDHSSGVHVLKPGLCEHNQMLAVSPVIAAVMAEGSHTLLHVSYPGLPYASVWALPCVRAPACQCEWVLDRTHGLSVKVACLTVSL